MNYHYGNFQGSFPAGHGIIASTPQTRLPSTLTDTYHLRNNSRKNIFRIKQKKQGKSGNKNGMIPINNKTRTTEIIKRLWRSEWRLL